jgi:hypothetical protein
VKQDIFQQNKTVSLVLSSTLIAIPIVSSGGQVPAANCLIATSFVGGLLFGMALQ